MSESEGRARAGDCDYRACGSCRGSPSPLSCTGGSRYGQPPALSPSVLCYHKITPHVLSRGDLDDTGPISPARSTFSVDRGYRFVSEDEFYGALSTPDPGSRQGYPSHLRRRLRGDPRRVLRAPRCRESIPVLVFLVAGYAGRPNDWDLSLGRRRFQAPLVGAGLADGGERGAFRIARRAPSDLTRVPPAERRARDRGVAARDRRANGDAR